MSNMMTLQEVRLFEKTRQQSNDKSLLDLDPNLSLKDIISKEKEIIRANLMSSDEDQRGELRKFISSYLIIPKSNLAY